MEEKTKKLQENLTEEKTQESSFSLDTVFSTIFEQWGLKLEKKQARYQLLENIGEGGMGVVQKVKDQILGREIALKRIKFPSSHQALSQKQQQRLWRLSKEASITAMLEHPNIVPLYDIDWNHEGELYFTMRKIQGKTLGQILEEKRNGIQNYEENKLLAIFLKICDAVAYAHSQKVIHRDLKPDNIMVGQFGEVYVMDWGIAKILKVDSFSPSLDEVETETDVHSIFQTIGGIGTLGYMPPEQRKNASQVTPQSDIYALGRILRECFTLKSPLFEFKEALHIYTNATSEKKTKKEEFKIPKDVHAIINKAIAEDPNHRYATVQEMITDIERYQTHSRVSARHYTWLELMQKWLIRNRQKIGVLGLVFVSLFFFYLYSQWKQNQDKNEKQKNLMQQTQETISQMQELQGEKKEVSNKKIQFLLQALQYTNSALFLKPQEVPVEIQKLAIGKELIQLCCDSAEYQFASYLAQDMNNLSIAEKHQTFQFVQQVNEAKTQQLRTHQKRLHLLLEEIQVPYIDSNFIENAILEISKMPEEEILQELLTILKEGLAQVCANKENLPISVGYYKNITDAVGYIGKTTAGTPLFELFSPLAEKLLKLSEQNRSLEEVEWLVALGKAMIRCKASKYAYEFDQIRDHFGETSGFGVSTLGFSEQLYQSQILEEEEPVTPEDFLNRSLFFANIKQFEKSWIYFDKAKLTNSNFLRILNVEANILFKQDRYLEAIEVYDRLLQQDPTDYNSYKSQAFAYFYMKNYEKALTLFDHAIKLNPNNFEAWLGRGQTKKFLKNLDGALEDIVKLIELAPQLGTGYSFMSEIKYLKKDYDDALKDVEKAIALQPNYAEPYFMRARIYVEQNKNMEAFKDIKTALKKDPRVKVDVFQILSLVVSAQKNYQEGILLLDETLKQNPNNWEAYISRGAIKSLLEQWKEALSDFLVAEEHLPENPMVAFNLANTYSALEEKEKALAYYQRAIELKPDYYEAYYNRGNVFFELNDLPSALKEMNQSISLQENFVPAYELRGKIYYFLGQLENSIQDYEKILYFEPRSESAYLSLGNVKDSQGQFKEAISYFSKGIELHPQNALFWYSRANVQQKIGQLKDALQDLEEAIRLDPKNALFYNLHGLLHDHLGKPNEALESYQKALALDSKNEIVYFNISMIYNKKNETDREQESLEKGLDVAENPLHYPRSIERWSSLCLKKAIRLYQKKEFENAQTELLKMKKYILANHPLYPRLEKMLEQIQAQLKTQQDFPK